MFKRILTASLLLGCLSLSGGGAQSNSLILQAGSFIGILISLVILFFFIKMISKSMGCLPSFLILCAIAVFIMYAFGMLDRGVAGVPDAIKVFLGQKQAQVQPADPVAQIVKQAEINVSGAQTPQNEPQPVQSLPLLPPIQAPEMSINPQSVSNEEHPTLLPTLPENSIKNSEILPPMQEENAYDKIFAEDIEPKMPVQQLQAQQLSSPQSGQLSVPQGPVDLLSQLPLIAGQVRVLNADTLSINGRNISLFGIDAPELSQTCTNRRGQSYNCGREAALWLKDWLGDHEIKCRIMKEDKRGNLLGVCMAGDYDIAAALVNEGLAFANQQMSEIYVPYQEQARANAKGLWKGSFYMPWDWRKMQSKKAKIKVIQKGRRKNNILDI